MKTYLPSKIIILNIFLVILISIILPVTAQNIAVTDDDSYTAASSAMLDVKSISKGLLIPRLTTIQREAINPAAIGLMVFDSDKNAFYYYNGSEWLALPQVSSTTVEGNALFAVKDAAGDTIFAVYNDGVKVVVPYGTKGKVGGFAVSGRSPTKAGEEEYLLVTPDSTRVFVNEVDVKGRVGGFAVSGRSPTKTVLKDYFISTSDSTRIYVEESAKGTVGGFAVSGRSPTKAGSVKFLDLTPKNYFIGHNSGAKTTGLYNSFIGYESGKNNEIGQYNSFFGYRTGMENTSGYSNVFIGYLSGLLNTTGYSNVFIGDSTGHDNTSGKRNIFIGSASGKANLKGYNNIFIGYLAGQTNTQGRNNLFLGTNSGHGNTIGDNNIFLGNLSGYTNSTGEYNTFLGFKAGYTNNASYNSFIGYQAGMGNTSGAYNSIIGYNAGVSNTTGFSNVFIGFQSGNLNTTGYSNVFIGTNTGKTNNGRFNIAIGDTAGYSLTTGEFNILIGRFAGYMLNAGRVNVLIGPDAGHNLTNQEYNVIIGPAAGYNINSLGGNGSYNTFMGINAGFKIQSSKENTFLGTNAGYFLENGWSNTIIGIDAGRGGNDNPTTYYGYLTERNTMLGCQAGRNLLNGSNNVYIGYKAGYNEVGTIATPSNNKLYIANSSSNPPLIYGDFLLARIGLGTITPAYKLDVVGDINITGNFKINGANLVTTTIVEGDLTATGPISLSATRKVIGGAATISIANASTSAKGVVQLSNAYNKFSEEYATTELALSNGLATKVTGAGMTIGKINQLGDGEIVSIAGGQFYLYWDYANSRILIFSNKSKAYTLFCWWQGQVGTTTSGETKELMPSKAPDNVIIPYVEYLGGYEIHVSDLDGTFSCSLWIQSMGDRLVGHYTQF